MWFKRKERTPDCAHGWFLADYETGYINAGNAVDIEDLFILHCSECGSKRRVDEYELRKLRQYGLIKEA